MGWLLPDLVRWWRYSDPGSGVSYLVTVIPLAFIWCGCVSELCAQGFHRLLDPEDKRTFDSTKRDRDLDALASLVHQGRTEEAVRLCHKLKASRDYSGLAIEALLTRLGALPPAEGRGAGKRPTLLAQAHQLRRQRRFGAAESKLRSLLAKDQENLAAALLLIRIYAQDLKNREKAENVLRQLERRPFVPPDLIDYARRSLEQWSQEDSQARPLGPGIESLLLRNPECPAPRTEAPDNGDAVDALLTNGYLGTAIEILENQVTDQPENFELALKFAEAHGHHCRNISRAEKIVSQIEANPAFSQEQVALAQAKLQEWRDCLNVV